MADNTTPRAEQSGPIIPDSPVYRVSSPGQIQGDRATRNVEEPSLLGTSMGAEQHTPPHHNQGVTSGAKPKLHYLLEFPKSATGISQVMEHGETKYPNTPWKVVSGERYTDASLMDSALRHMMAYMNGESVDPESGLNHMFHAVVNLMMFIDRR